MVVDQTRAKLMMLRGEYVSAFASLEHTLQLLISLYFIRPQIDVDDDGSAVTASGTAEQLRALRDEHEALVLRQLRLEDVINLVSHVIAAIGLEDDYGDIPNAVAVLKRTRDNIAHSLVDVAHDDLTEAIRTGRPLTGAMREITRPKRRIGLVETPVDADTVDDQMKAMWRVHDRCIAVMEGLIAYTYGEDAGKAARDSPLE